MADILELPRLQLRRGESLDLPATVELVYAAWHHAYDSLLPRSLTAARTRSRVRDQLASEIEAAWLACLGPRPLGYMMLDANKLEQLCVAPSHRRRGVGSLLLEQALAEFRVAGYHGIQASCEDFNEAACRFFEHHGWRIIGAEPQFLAPGLTVGSLVYSRQLGAEWGP